jgi:hypothetical protein
VAKKLRCYVGLHRWVETVREGEKYDLCRYCGKKTRKEDRYFTGGAPPGGPPVV